jgi:predicted permease
MTGIVHDLRYGLRTLLGNPGFTATAVITLALGIAANIAVFGWIDAMLVRPIPGASDPGRLTAVEWVVPDGGDGGLSLPDLRDFQKNVTMLDGLAGAHFTPFSVGPAESAQHVWGQVVTANFFHVLGVRAAVGRLFLPEEDVDSKGAFPLAVISDRLWRGRFRGDPGVIGKPIEVNGRFLTLIGVTPPEFRGTITGLTLDIWTPHSLVVEMGAVSNWPAADRQCKHLHGFARLKPGVTLAQAQSQLTSEGGRIAAAFPRTHGGFRALIVPLWKAHTGAQAMLLEPLAILMAVCFVVLGIACANVANLLLARSVSRQKEFSIRLAMGVSRGRLIRQVLTEALILAGAGAVAGVSLALWMGPLLGYLLPQTELPITINEGLSLRAYLFAILTCLFAAGVSGVVPALFAARTDLNGTLKEGGRSGRGGARSHRARAALVISEVALASLAVIGAGLFLRSFQNVRSVDPGFDQRNVLVARFYLAPAGYSAAQEKQFCRRLAERLEAAPGVESVAYADWAPLAFGNGPWEGVKVDGYVTDHASDIKVGRGVVGPGYLSLLRIPLRDGRDFTARDDEKSERVVIVNETFARRFFPERNPLGRKVRISNRDFHVIGVAKDSKYTSPAEPPQPHFYTAHQQTFLTGWNTFLFIRTASDPAGYVTTLRREVMAIDPKALRFHAMPLADFTQASLYTHKVAASLLTGLGTLSLMLAALGLYSVLAYAVNERTHEIGIRIAMGAQSGDVLRLIVGKGLGLTLAGLAVGVGCALAAARLVAAMLVNVGAADPLTFAGAALFLTVVALVACYFPARRAMKVDPMVALRS